MESKFEMAATYLYRNNPFKMGLAHLLELMITANKLIFPLFLLNSFSKSDEKKLSSTFLGISFLSFLVNACLPKIKDLLIAQVHHDTQRNVTLDMVRAVYSKELDTLLGTPTGSCAIIASKTYDPGSAIIPTFFSEILPSVLETIGISSILSYRYGKIGLSPIIILSAYLLLAFYREQVSKQITEENSLLKREGFGQLLFSINNYQAAHQYGNTTYELDKLNSALSKLESSYNAIQLQREKSSFLLSSISQLGIISTVAYALLRSFNSKFLLEDLMTFGYYMFRFNSIIDSLPVKISRLSTGLIDARLITDFLQEKPKVKEPDDFLEFRITKPPRIEFKNVNFNYSDKSTGLSDINFSVNPGQKIVIMGATGSGKSTLLKLIQRFYDSFEGQILIDNFDIKSISKEDLRGCLSIISQETTLMDASTVYDNIKYGDLNAKEEEVSLAAKFAGLKFDKLQFFSPVQQGGSNFSGGEKQRVNIARALLKKNTYVFLLDEPTSSLDQQTTQDVLKTLDQLPKVATVLIVTHDPYVAVNADYILYLDEGKIIERGTFKELMFQQGSFYNQVVIQCKKLGISSDDIKPINQQEQETESSDEFIHWRNQRNTLNFS